ncbi:hypothetical protein IKG49_01990 [Candidatus Saccharibacteria bacterium]|nr:hypothetical protein [Candidatus Saccharibacteria bacterium]
MKKNEVLFCKRAEDFSLEELNLSQEDYELLKGIASKLKRPLSYWLKKARREHCFLGKQIRDCLKKAKRNGGGCDPWSVVCDRIYNAIIDAGYIRETYSFKNYEVFLFAASRAALWFKKGSYVKKTVNCLIRDSGGYSAYLDDDCVEKRVRVTREIKRLLPFPILLAFSRQYESYDYSRLDNKLNEIMEIIWSPEQRRVIEWVANVGPDYSISKIFTTAEYELFIAGVYSLIYNAERVKYFLRDYFPKYSQAELNYLNTYWPE